MGKKIVITGMGVLSPLGIGSDATWQGMVDGNSGAGPITRFDASEHKTGFACEVKGFDPLDYIERKAAKRMDLYCQFAMAAANEAVERSGIDTESLNRERVGVVVGSGIGGMNTYEEQLRRLLTRGPSKISPFFIPMMIGDIAAGQISIRYQFKGPNYAVQSACATASHAVGIACMHLQLGDADAMICGGAEASVTPIGVAGFNSMTALSTRNDNPQAASRPFDNDRDGFVIGEGSAVFVMETEEHAKQRGAEILAEFAGYGFSADAYHLTAPIPGGLGAVRSMNIALEKAGCKPEDVGYVNAHGTSTPYNDETETEALKTVFGDYAFNLAVSSTKSMTGHLLGAAGAIELFACTQAIRTGIIPPTINLTNPDPKCDLYYVPNEAIKRDINIALSNTFGFGGHNATLIVRKWES